MGEIGRWGGHVFEVSPQIMRSFSGLTIKGASETEEKESSSDKYVSRKNAKPTEISLRVQLNALLGCDVREEALGFVEDARTGRSDWFYIGEEKLVPQALMLTEASVDSVAISPAGTWVEAEVRMTMKQAGTGGGSVGGDPGGGDPGGGSGSGDGGRASVYTQPVTTTQDSIVSHVIQTTDLTAVPSSDVTWSSASSVMSTQTQNTVSNAVATISQTIASGRQQTESNDRTNGNGGGTGRGNQMVNTVT